MVKIHTLAALFVATSMLLRGMDSDSEKRFLDDVSEAGVTEGNPVDVHAIDLNDLAPESNDDSEPDSVAMRLASCIGGGDDIDGTHYQISARLRAFHNRWGRDAHQSFVRNEGRSLGLAPVSKSGSNTPQFDMMAIFERVLESKEKELEALHRERELEASHRESETKMRLELEQLRVKAHSSCIEEVEVSRGWRARVAENKTTALTAAVAIAGVLGNITQLFVRYFGSGKCGGGGGETPLI